MINVSLETPGYPPIDFELDDEIVAMIDRLVGTGFGFSRAAVIKNVIEHALRRNESIGRCEDCGLIDHHLIDGLCEPCRGKYTVNTASGISLDDLAQDDMTIDTVGFQYKADQHEVVMNLPAPGDQVFTDSPDAGDPACLCSRCGLVIPENETPLRLFRQQGNQNQGEFRYHEGCAI